MDIVLVLFSADDDAYRTGPNAIEGGGVVDPSPEVRGKCHSRVTSGRRNEVSIAAPSGKWMILSVHVPTPGKKQRICVTPLASM